MDSGADSSLFPDAMMPLLGIDKADCKEIQGKTASGNCTYWHWDKGKLEAEIEGKHVNLVAMFSATERALLGRRDFFRVFKVAFDERKQRFRLDPY